MVDVEIRSQAMPRPSHPDGTVLRAASSQHHTAYLLGDDARRFVIVERPDLTVLVAGAALAAAPVRARFEAWASTFGWDRAAEAVRALKTDAGTSFVAVALADGRALVFGDPFGAVPLYMSEDGRLLGTNPDAIGHATGAPYDPVSYADMAVTKRVCHPFTLYDGIRQVSPADYVVLSGAGATVHPSGYRPPALAPQEICESATATLERSLEEHVDGVRPLLAISGGLDSRVLASLLGRRGDARSFSITERPSRDAAIGAAVAEHRRIPHETVVLGGRAFVAVAARVVTGSTSQSSALHAHFAPLRRQLRAWGDVLVTGYGANANFERYDNVAKVLTRIEASGLPAGTMAELVRRWTAHAAAVEKTFGLPPAHLATAWPATHKKAFAFVTMNRHLVPTFDPFLIMPELFAAKAHVAKKPSDLARQLFRTFCGDEAHLPTTRLRHPLGASAEAGAAADGAEPQDAGWPQKDRMFSRLARGADKAAFARLAADDDPSFFRQLCATNAVWREHSGEGSRLRRVLARLR